MKILDMFKSKKKVNDGRFYKLTESCQIMNLDEVYEQYFGKIKTGCFVEFGAFDGESFSNTSGLADIGWNGYYIEPVKEYFEKCQDRHRKNKNITVSNYAIGDKKQKIEIEIAGVLSTVSTNMKNNFKEIEWAKSLFADGKKECVQMILLEEYLAEHNVETDFDLLVIDVEGYEWNSLKNFDIEKWHPKMVIIELHDQNDNYLSIRKECNQIVEYFSKANYKVIYKDKTNTIYVQKDLYPIIDN